MIPFMSFAGQKIVLESGNTFVINTVFDEALLKNFSRVVHLHDNSKPLYVYFESPGGSVISLASMVQIMKTSDIKFVCITRLAASAAFVLFEHCTERYILPEGILMSHNASVGLEGKLPQVRHLLDILESLVSNLEESTAERMKMGIEKYRNLIAGDLWINSKTIQKYNAADGVVDSLKCSKEFAKTTAEQSPLIADPYTSCPLINLGGGYTGKSSSLGQSGDSDRVGQIYRSFNWIF